MGLMPSDFKKVDVPHFIARHFPFVDFNLQSNIKILEVTMTTDRTGIINKMLTCETTARVIEEKLLKG